MITNLSEYYEDVMARGTIEAKTLLNTECLFAATEARRIEELFKSDVIQPSIRDIQERLVCLLICHRGPVISQFIIERATGLPMNESGPVVIPDKGL